MPDTSLLRPQRYEKIFLSVFPVCKLSERAEDGLSGIMIPLQFIRILLLAR